MHSKDPSEAGPQIGFDFADLEHWEEVEAALHGDLRPLVRVLRSGVKISAVAREYLASELEREPRKRFSRKLSKDLSKKKTDQLLLYRVFNAKMELAYAQLTHATHDERLDHAIENFRLISDYCALDKLAELGITVDHDMLRNARERSGPGFWDSKYRNKTIL